MALQTDFSKQSINATKFLVHLRLFNSPSVDLAFVSSFNVNIESRAQDFIPPGNILNKCIFVLLVIEKNYLKLFL